MNQYSTFEIFGKRFCKTNKSKIPLKPDGTPAKSNNPATWSDYKTAVSSLKDSEMLGVFLGGGDDVPPRKVLACIDLDKCRDKSGNWQDLPLDIVTKAQSYTEISMSGNGLHVFGYCDDSIKTHKKPGIEIYTEKRYIALTGNQAFGQYQINDISAAISQIIEAHLKVPEKPKEKKPKYANNFEKAVFLIDNLFDKVNNYDDFVRIAAALAHEFGKKGESLFAKFAENPQYSDSPKKVKAKYASFLKAANAGKIVTLATVIYIAKKYGVYLPVELAAWRNAEKVTDNANAEIIAGELAGEWLFVHDMKSWYYYEHESGLWQQDKMKKIYTTILEITQRIIKQENESRSNESRDFIKNAIALENVEKMKKALELASAMLPAMICEFDTNPKMIAVKNGVIDLNKLDIIPHNPDYKLTYCINSHYNKNAKCPNWSNFLNEVQPDTDMQNFIKRLIGATLLGANDIQKFPVFYGRGGNGKSVFIDTIVQLFNDLAVKLPTSALMLMANNQDKTQNELYRARAARIVYATETAQNHTLNESIIKDITGGEKITARALYRESIEFYPRFIPFLIGNYKPTIKTADYGTWRRVLLIPWGIEIPPEKRKDKTELITTFMQESAGIFNWMLEGTRDFKKSGLQIPEDVTAATEEYKSDSDLIGEYIASEIRFHAKGAGVPLPISAAFKTFKEFLEASGDIDSFQGTQRKFTMELKNRGYKIVRRSGNQPVWVGAELAKEEDMF